MSNIKYKSYKNVYNKTPSKQTRYSQFDKQQQCSHNCSYVATVQAILHKVLINTFLVIHFSGSDPTYIFFFSYFINNLFSTFEK